MHRAFPLQVKASHRFSPLPVGEGEGEVHAQEIEQTPTDRERYDCDSDPEQTPSSFLRLHRFCAAISGFFCATLFVILSLGEPFDVAQDMLCAFARE
jgi:hypothetical protein